MEGSIVTVAAVQVYHTQQYELGYYVVHVGVVFLFLFCEGIFLSLMRKVLIEFALFERY